MEKENMDENLLNPDTAKNGEENNGEAKANQDDESISWVSDELETDDTTDDTTDDGDTNTPPKKGEASWVSKLRKRDREKTKRIRELEQKLGGVASKDNEEDELGPKPKPSDPDIDFDSEKFEQRITEWVEKKTLIENKKRKKQDEEKRSQDEWNKKLSTYHADKNKTDIEGYNESEEFVVNVLSPAQQSVIIRIAKNPVGFIHKLANHPETLEKLSKISDLIDFTSTVTRLEMNNGGKSVRKPTTKPEDRLDNISGGGAGVDKKLEELRARAEKTGDYTEVRRYKNSLKK